MNKNIKITLKVLGVKDPAVTVYVNEHYEILQKYSDPTVEIEFDIVAWEDYFPTMLKAFKGEASYDIVMVAGHLWLADFVSQGYLEPLKYDFEDIIPIISEEMQYQNKTYLSPSFCDGHMIVYRKSIVEKAIGKKMKSVITVDEFIEIANQLKESGIQTPIALKAHESEIMTDALPYLRSDGYDIYEIEQKNIKCNIDKMASGLNKYISLKQLAPSDTHTYGNEEIKQALGSKKVAMAVTWSGQLGVLMQECEETDDLGFATFDTAWNVTWSFGITKTSQNKEKAVELLAYLRSAPVDKAVGQYCGAPVRRTNYVEDMDKYPWYKTQLEMIEKQANPFINVLLAGEKNRVLYEEVFLAFTGKKEVNQALLDAKDKIEQI